MGNVDVIGMGEDISISRDVGRIEDFEKNVVRGGESVDKDWRGGRVFRFIFFFRFENIERLFGRLFFFRVEMFFEVFFFVIVFFVMVVKFFVFVFGINVMKVKFVFRWGVRNNVNNGVNVIFVVIISKIIYCNWLNYLCDCFDNERVVDVEVIVDVIGYGFSYEFVDSEGRKFDIIVFRFEGEFFYVDVLNRWMDIKSKVFGRKDRDGRKMFFVGRKNKVDNMRWGLRRL